MEELTIKKARQILGTDAKQVSDEELKCDIEAAILFKDLFFNNYIKNRKRASTDRPNMP